MLQGRDQERAALAALIEGARVGRAGAVVVHGEAGIGKSALLQDVVQDLYAVRVLRIHGMESESPLPFAALQRLLRPLSDRLDDLPAPQAAALGAALGLVQIETVEPFLVAIGTLTILTEAADDEPVICVIDDAHWLDPASAEVLLIVARRIDADRVGMIFAARDGDTRSFHAEGVTHLALTGLDEQAARSLLSAAAPGPIAPAVAEALLQASAGNPLALVELPSSLTREQLDGTTTLATPLPSVSRVTESFLRRYHALPRESQTLLLVAIADDTGRRDIVQEAAAKIGAGSEAVDQAEQSGLITAVGNQLSLRHPLVRSAIYQAASPTDRERAHSSLAEVLGSIGDVDRQVWHRAAVSTHQDADLAASLEEAAGRAERRGAYVVAADAYERAADLFPMGDEAARRLLGAGRAAWASGRAARAKSSAERARPLTSDPLLLADVDRLRGRVELNVGSAATGHRIFVDAAHAVATHDQNRGLEMAVAASIAQGHGGGSGASLDAALFDSAPSEDDSPRTRCLKQLFVSTQLYLSEDLRTAITELRAALQTGRLVDDVDVLGNLGNAALHVGDDDSHRDFYTLMLTTARARGDAMSVLYALQRLGFSQLVGGLWGELRSSSEEAVSLSESLGQRASSAAPRAWLLLLAALQGGPDYDDRLVELETFLRTHPSPGIFAHPIDLMIRWAKAMHAAASADPTATRHHFERLDMPVFGLMTSQERIDAALRAGDAEQAQAWLQTIATFAVQTDWSWAHAAASFGRARLHEAADDPPPVVTPHFDAALEHHSTAGRPFDRARTHLAYGEYLRRIQHRVDARAQLRAALHTFEDLSASPWAERASQELRASGETARKRDESTLTQLTPMERKVAELVRQGMTNKEVAAQIWVSPRTVAFHLRNVFAKAGITSRGQLAQLNLSQSLSATTTPQPER